jgi:hypothetical protein
MFNLGPKKPPASRPLWRLQLLTSEYLIEGSFRPEENMVGSANIFEMACESTLDGGGVEAFHRLQLSAVQLQPTGQLAAPARSYPEWGIPVFDNVLAILPKDEDSLQAAQKAFKEYRYPLQVEIFMGPYRLRGKLLADSTIPLRSPFVMSQIVPLVEAEIDNLLPGAQLTGLRADWLLLNGSALMHGYGITGA